MIRYLPYLLLGHVLAGGMLLSNPKTAGAEPAGKRVVLLVPEHKAYRIAAQECERFLQSKGAVTTTISIGNEPESGSTPVANTTGAGSATTQPTTSSSYPGRGSTSPESGFRAQISSGRPDVIVAFGEDATVMAIENSTETPVVYSMISNGLDCPAVAGGKYQQRLAGVTTDLRPADQLKWIRTLQPTASRLGVLHSSRSVKTAEAIKVVAAPLGVTVSLIETSKDEFAHAIEILTSRQCDAVLMIADAQIYNPVTVKRLLLWGVRNKRGVWAFSENFVRAGALGCLYTDPESIGRQTAAVAMRILSGTKPADMGMQYPDAARRAYNERTAKLIELSPPAGNLEGVLILGREP